MTPRASILRPLTIPSTTAAVAAVLALGASCRTQSESWDNRVDCDTICDRYSACFNPTFDVESCEDRCFDRAQVDYDFEFQVDRCSTCMRDLTCELIDLTECREDCAPITGEPVLGPNPLDV